MNAIVIEPYKSLPKMINVFNGYSLVCYNSSLPVTVIDAVELGLDFDALLSSGCTDSKFVSVISGRTKHCNKPCIKSEIIYIKTLEFFDAMHFIQRCLFSGFSAIKMLPVGNIDLPSD